ncbi:MAG: hypothetical protein ACI9WC_003011 [Arenicella sp.]|jgi:hypothetical protein
MKVLIACEYSGRVRDAFKAKGHFAMSCDFHDTEVPGEHYQGDVRDVLSSDWDLMVAHPECTYLCNSGVCHLHKDAKRWLKLFDSAEFFRMLLNSGIEKTAVENPVMHKYGKQLIGQQQSQIIHPHMFGHMEQKQTCLWLKGLPSLVSTNNVKEEMMKLPNNERQRLHYLPPSPDRWKERSRTYQGIADAMAKQWSNGQSDLLESIQ